MASDSASRTRFRELAYRADDGLEVALLWNEREDRLAVSVSDYHPYAHAAWQAA